MGQKARRTIQVLMKKHHQLSVLVGEEYVGKAQKAKELKGIAEDKAGEEQRVVGARQRERRSGKEASRETHESTARYVCVFPLRGGTLRLLI